MAPKSFKAGKQKKSCSVIKCTAVALTIVPALMFASAVYHSSSLLKVQQPGGSADDKYDSQRVLTGDFLGRSSGATDRWSNESSLEHWEKKRKFIASEPTTGNWLLDCPDEPPPGYPQAWPIMDIIHNWSPDETEVRGADHFHFTRILFLATQELGVTRLKCSWHILSHRNYALSYVGWVYSDVVFWIFVFVCQSIPTSLHLRITPACAALTSRCLGTSAKRTTTAIKR